MQTIGEKIKKLRKSKNISQEELSFELGVSRQTIHKWENNTVRPSTENLKSLSDYFKVNVAYFFGEEIVVGNSNDKNVNDEVTLSEVSHSSKRNLIICAIAIAVISLAFIISLAFTIGCGLIVFTDNTGYDYVSVLEVKKYSFYLFLILSLILLSLDGVMIFFIKKR